MLPYWPAITVAVFGASRPEPGVTTSGADSWPSRYAVSDFATASIGAAGQALADLTGGDVPVTVDRRLASLWFHGSVEPLGWQIPDTWDDVAGNYAGRDGWIRLHTNAPHHRAAALSVLQTEGTRDEVAQAVAGWDVAALETAVVAAGGAAASLRSPQDWTAHPQGRAVAASPLIVWEDHDGEVVGGRAGAHPSGPRPLSGLRVLDLTRVLAGPVATRFLAGFGAEVLRIDPPDWDEPAVLPDVTPGKRRAGLDLRSGPDRAVFEDLLRGADVIVHGYRPGALDTLGYGAAERRAFAPGLIDVSLSAYGTTGPWADRRGFDSLVQMSSGIAAPLGPGEMPHPLPVQALDHATGSLMAAAVLRAVRLRGQGRCTSARLSLARTGLALIAEPGNLDVPSLLSGDDDWTEAPERTGWGLVRRLRPPLTVGDVAPEWVIPAGPLRSDPPVWQG